MQTRRNARSRSGGTAGHLQRNTQQEELPVVAEYSFKNETYVIVPVPDSNAASESLSDAAEYTLLGTDPRSIGVAVDEAKLSSSAAIEAESFKGAIDAEKVSYIELSAPSFVGYTLANGWKVPDVRPRPASPLEKGASFNLTVEGKALEFTRHGPVERTASASIWRGQVSGGGDAELILLDEGTIVGSFVWDGSDFSIQPLSGNQHAIVRLPPRQEEIEPPLEASPTPDGASEKPLEAADMDDSTAYVDVLILYSPRVRSEISVAAQREAVALIESANLTFSSRQNPSIKSPALPVELRLAGVEIAEGYTEPTVPYQWEHAYDWLATSALVEQLRATKYQADLAILLTKKLGRACGWAKMTRHSSDQGFAVVRYACLKQVGRYTFAHEIGHIAGADHDKDCSANPAFSYGHGFVSGPQKIGTLMSSCFEATCPGCKRLDVWSGPNSSYEQVTLGRARDSDNQRVWRNEAHRLAEFRP